MDEKFAFCRFVNWPYFKYPTCSFSRVPNRVKALEWWLNFFDINTPNIIIFLIKSCFIIPNIRCRYTSQQTLSSICNENAPQHTDIVWKGLVLQTRTWKWTAVIIFAISCISNSSSNSNNSSNNDNNSN